MIFSKPTFRKSFGAIAVATTLIFTACGDSSTTNSEENTTTADSSSAQNATAAQQSAVATLTGTKEDTTLTGTVRFEAQGDGKVKMTLDITVDKMANKSVAAHIHENSDCGEHGNHAGGHWNPTGENHGKWGEGQYHSGDFGNIQLDGSGKGTLEITSDRWTIGGDEKTNVVNKAVIVHSGQDDYKSQPSGNSGSRIGCGVINTGQ
jgi:Cu-Zn family superoxide dismutase